MVEWGIQPMMGGNVWLKSGFGLWRKIFQYTLDCVWMVDQFLFAETVWWAKPMTMEIDWFLFLL
jgi:hypothetical protein